MYVGSYSKGVVSSFVQVLKAFFLGTLQVDKPCGIDVVHAAINHLADSVPRAEWRSSTVAVAPSTITITYSEGGRKQQQQLDCRVRFLSFLGIGEDSRQAAFIMHTAQDTFVAHAFHCEPSAGPLCKTIEAACKLRYQKCLDARPQQQQQQQQQQPHRENQRSSIGASIKSMLSKGRSRLLTSPPSGPPPS